MKRTLLAAVAHLALSCSDPVRDGAIAELGPEAPNVPPGPDHRPGQPCVVCHSAGGPASSKPFVVAGTVYRTLDPPAGAEGIEVRIIDADGKGPRDPVITGRSGNFFVPEGPWAVTYPFRTGLFRDGKEIVSMRTTVNREPSCNYCHRGPDAPSGLTPEQKARRYYTPIVVAGGP